MTTTPPPTDAIRTVLEGWYLQSGIRLGVIGEASYQLSTIEAEVAALRERCEAAERALLEFTEAANERDLALAIDSAIHSIDRDAAADTFTVYLFDYDAEQGVGFTRRALIDALQDAKRYMREVPGVDDVGAAAASEASAAWFKTYHAARTAPAAGVTP